MNKYITSFLVALTYSTCLNAQSINGVVMENDSVFIPYATVSLLQASDSAYVTGVVSNEDGTFAFDASPVDKLVKISYVGCKTLILPASEHMTVLLSPSEQILNGVTITATRPAFRMKNGVFVSSIQGTVYSQLGRATDVLQQLPMMSTDGVSVLGRGTPLIYINNKRMRSWSELDRITSDMIKDIRIDMNPGAKYGSSVRAVLFITTLKPVGEGLGGTLTMKESVSSCWTTDGWLDLNYRHKGLDVFMSSSYETFSKLHYLRTDTYRFRYGGQDVNADYSGDGYSSSKNGSVILGFNNQFSEKQSLGATYIFSRTFSGHSDQSYHNHMQQGNELTEFDTRSHTFSQNGSHNVSLYYENRFSDKLALNVDASYVHNNSNGRQTVESKQNTANSMLIPVNKIASDLGALKTVFSSSLGKNQLEYGFEATYTHFRQKYNIDNSDYTGVLENNDNESKQSAASVFINYSRSFGHLSSRLGLKYEYTNYDYYAGGKLINASSRTYHRLLPSVSFSYDVNRLSLMLSYNIYTSNPTYSQLDDGLHYISDFRYDRGNSQMKPTYNHNVSFSASYKDLIFICDYTYGKNAVITWFDVMNQVPAVLSGEENHSYSSAYSSLSYAPTLFKIWKPSWNLWVHKQWLSHNGLSYNRPQWGLQWKNFVTLPKDWYIVVNVSGNLKGNADTYMSEPLLRVDMAVQKNMKNWWVKLSALDLFNSKEKGYSQYAEAYTSHRVDYRHPVISLTVSYSFNPVRSKYKGQTAGQSELKRL